MLCKICGREFERTNANVVYCSDECKKAGRKESNRKALRKFLEFKRDKFNELMRNGYKRRKELRKFMSETTASH